MSAEKEQAMKPAQEKEPQVAEAVVTVPVINDSSAGLARMYADLNPLAARLRGSATMLLFFSILFMGSLEGLFGLIAACGVLCCAAPGSLGTAYAARCTRITATVAAVLSFTHVMCLATFSLAVVPEMPMAIRHTCAEAHFAFADAKLAAPSDAAAPISSLLLTGLAAADAEGVQTADQDMVLVAPSKPAKLVAAVATSAARRLQELSPSELEPCARAARFFESAVPTLVLGALFVELCLFFSAVSTANAAARLMLAARKYGANAM